MNAVNTPDVPDEQTKAVGIQSGKTIRLVPVEIFGQSCEHPAHQDEPVPFSYGICDAIQAWSDCNRAIGRIFRVDDLEGHRLPEETILVWASDESLARLDRKWGAYAEDPPTDQIAAAEARGRAAGVAEGRKQAAAEIVAAGDAAPDGESGAEYYAALAIAEEPDRG